MSERPFMQLYVSDFVGDTLHLSTEQIGAYMLLLMAMWNAGGKLPAEDAKLARVVRLSVKKWRAIAPDLMPFLDTDGVQIWHNRLTKELQKSARKSERRAASGAKGGDAKALKSKDEGLANASVLLQHSPDTIKKEKEKRSQKASKPIAKPDASNSASVAHRGPQVRLHRDDPRFLAIARLRGVDPASMQVSGRDGCWTFEQSELDRALAREGPDITGLSKGINTKLEMLN
ncbi:DUF1376 domain-containing protein [uncultured Devosia sp.]|uniref:YdaU family protein n=1 Tax=uncultured Devosia sp. TaxID=211434 RepID=UPI002620C2E9|nr:DUF1376 domain-containing protein [uncultured Devosia sp.]